MQKTVWLFLVAAVACGGGESEAYNPEADYLESSAGGEEDPMLAGAGEGLEGDEDVLAEDGPTPAAGGPRGDAPAATGPARLTVGISVEGESAPGKVKVLSASGDVIKEGPAGRTYTLPPGTYTLVAEVTDASVLVDKPSRTGEAFDLEAGDERTENVEMGRSKVRLKVMKGNRHVRNTRVELMRQGSEEVVLDFKPGNQHISISPGRYDAVVHMGNTRVEVDGIVFMGGATQDIPIRVQ